MYNVTCQHGVCFELQAGQISSTSHALLGTGLTLIGRPNIMLLLLLMHLYARQLSDVTQSAAYVMGSYSITMATHKYGVITTRACTRTSGTPVYEAGTWV